MTNSMFVDAAIRKMAEDALARINEANRIY
jgi:hypothetical protein